MEPPLPFGNAAARWYFTLIRGLHARGYQLTTFAACRSDDDAHEAQALFPPPTHDLRCYVQPRRRGVTAKLDSLLHPHSYVFAPALRRGLDRELARGFDVLHLEHIWSGWLGRSHRDRAVLTVQYLVAIDLAAIPPTSPVDRVRRRAIERAERRLLRRYRTLATVSPELTARVRELVGHGNVHTVPLAFDLSLYRFEEPPATDGPVVGLIGSFAWQPTYDAAVRLVTRLWPAIKQRVPKARLQLVGRHAARALAAFQHLPDVAIVDTVPEIAPYFRAMDVLLYAPERGSGMKVKVMEAFAFGTPVVTTTAGIEGIPAEDGVHAGISNDDAGLVERTVELLHDFRSRQGRRAAARRLIERHCDPARVLDLLEGVYATCG